MSAKKRGRGARFALLRKGEPMHEGEGPGDVGLAQLDLEGGAQALG